MKINSNEFAFSDCDILQVRSYDGILRYTVSYEMKPGGELTTDTDVELTVCRGA